MMSLFTGCKSTTLPLNGPAPDFTAPATGGKDITLSGLKGKWVILYFYPKADTPGCTKEACSLRDGYTVIQGAGAVIVGVSLDSVEAQEKFKEKYHLPFELVSDSKKTIAKSYHVLATGGLFTQRKTFVINPEGNIVHIFDKVDVNKHSDEVLAVLKNVGKTASSAPAPDAGGK